MSDDLMKRLRAGYCNNNDTDEAADRIEQLEAALRSLIAACDKGKIKPKTGMSGMTTTANMKSSWINNVEAWAVEDARKALEGKDD